MQTTWSCCCAAPLKLHKDSLIVYAWRKLDVWRSSSHRHPYTLPHHQQQRQNQPPFGLCWKVGGGGGAPASACFLPWSSSVDLVEEDDEAEQQVPGSLCGEAAEEKRDCGTQGLLILSASSGLSWCVGTWKGLRRKSFFLSLETFCK